MTVISSPSLSPRSLDDDALVETDLTSVGLITTAVGKGIKLDDFFKNFGKFYNYPMNYCSNCEFLDDVDYFLLSDCHISPEANMNNTLLIQLLWNQHRKTVYFEFPRTVAGLPTTIQHHELDPSIKYLGWDDQTDLTKQLFDHSQGSCLASLFEAAAFIERIQQVVTKDLKAPFHKGSSHDSLEIIALELNRIFEIKRKELENYIKQHPNWKSFYRHCITYTSHPQNPLRLLNCTRLLCHFYMDKLSSYLTTDTWITRQKSLCRSLMENDQGGFVVAGMSHFVENPKKDRELVIEKTLKKHLVIQRKKYCIIAPNFNHFATVQAMEIDRVKINFSFRTEKPFTHTSYEFYAMDSIIQCKLRNLSQILHSFYDLHSGQKKVSPVIAKTAIVRIREVRLCFECGEKPHKMVAFQKKYQELKAELDKQKLKLKDHIRYKYGIKKIRETRKEVRRLTLEIKKLINQTNK